jgi:type VI secretion system lysozyme-like protein
MPNSCAPRSRLLERLIQREPGSIDEQVASALQSIQQHLELLLNSRPDSCRGAPALGLIDFNATALGCTDLRTRLAEEIRQCITHYEPRLQQVRVSHSERLEPSRVRRSVQPRAVALKSIKPNAGAPRQLSGRLLSSNSRCCWMDCRALATCSSMEPGSRWISRSSSRERGAQELGIRVTPYRVDQPVRVRNWRPCI